MNKPSGKPLLCKNWSLYRAFQIFSYLFTFFFTWSHMILCDQYKAVHNRVQGSIYHQSVESILCNAVFLCSEQLWLQVFLGSVSTNSSCPDSEFSANSVLQNSLSSVDRKCLLLFTDLAL